MKKETHWIDPRIKKQIWPVSSFFISFISLGLFTTLQMKIIGNYIDFKSIPVLHQISVFGLWFLAALFISIYTVYQIRESYEKPIEKLSKAAHDVAMGDFSVYLSPEHLPTKLNSLDVLYLDFNKMVEELGSIETLKIDFFSNVSHEIKTPLSIIQNSAELLQDSALSEEDRKDYTDTILQATKRLSNLITNMLKLNKLEKQSIPFATESYDLCEQIRQCALQFEDIWEEKEIELEIELEDSRFIETDLGLLEMVWSNLFSNAFKFTPVGGMVRVTEEYQKGMFSITVSDTGKGMNKETQKHIFDKFYQGDTSHSTEGNGLGLALVKRILELIDGSISVQSKEGEGTTFHVILPDKLEEKEETYGINQT